MNTYGIKGFFFYRKLSVWYQACLCFLCTVAVLSIAQYVTGDMFAYADTIKFTGQVAPLISALRGVVRLARVTMMFVAALLGIICGVMWYTGQQQAQGMLQKFFVAVFFIFAATAILDAVLGMTIGDLEVDTSKASSDAIKKSNERWMGGETTSGGKTPKPKPKPNPGLPV